MQVDKSESKTINQSFNGMLSIAIPLYNKRPFITKTIQSCILACEKASIQFEIVISNNASSDANTEDLDQLASRHKNVRIIHLPHTISVGENWLFALNSCQGQYIKLQLADDPMPEHDLNRVIRTIEEQNSDYAIGLTQPVFESKDFTTKYFDYVNPFRSRISPVLTKAEKARLIFDDMAHSRNPFGDINALTLHQKCLDSLNLGVKTGLPAFTTFPDLAIYLTLFAHHNGSFTDEVTSYFVYNDTSPAVRRQTDSEMTLHGLYSEYEAMLPLYFISSYRLKALTDELSLEEKRLYWQSSQEHIQYLIGLTGPPATGHAHAHNRMSSNESKAERLWKKLQLILRKQR